MGVLTGSTSNAEVARPVKVKSVLVTSGAGVIGALSLFRYSDTGGNALLTVVAPSGGTLQVVFEGVPFSDGLSVDPDADVLSYLVEYDEA